MDYESIKSIPKNMRRTGMLLFRSALMEALNNETPMCVVHAAHAAEILLKARIAEEHPLLIFSRLPKMDTNKSSLLLMDLIEDGRTLTYQEIPDQLWAATGIKINRIEQYRDFGRLRDQIIHISLASANNLAKLTTCYALQIIDPLVESFWGSSVIEFIERDPISEYASLLHSGILEDAIRNYCQIDNRLRRLLGERSESAWKRLVEIKKEDESLFLSKTSEELAAEYANRQRHKGIDVQYEESLNQLDKDQANWNSFLDAF